MFVNFKFVLFQRYIVNSTFDEKRKQKRGYLCYKNVVTTLLVTTLNGCR